MNGSQRSPLDGEIRDGRHFLTVRVYYEDTDFSGIVYHANFLRYLERWRTNPVSQLLWSARRAARRLLASWYRLRQRETPPKSRR